MEYSTDQDIRYMTLKHRLLGVVTTTFLGFSAFVLSAQENAQTEQRTLEQSNASSESVVVELVQDQLTKTYLQELSKEEFKEYMLNLDQYSATDQATIRLEYNRRCSGDSPVRKENLCPEDIEPTFGNIERTSEESDASSDQPEMPKLIEENVKVGSTVSANDESELPIGRDPRLRTEQKEPKNGRSAWRNKPKTKDDLKNLEN